MSVDFGKVALKIIQFKYKAICMKFQMPVKYFKRALHTYNWKEVKGH